MVNVSCSTNVFEMVGLILMDGFFNHCVSHSIWIFVKFLLGFRYLYDFFSILNLKYFHIIICHLLWISAADTTDIILTTAAAACATIDIVCCNLHMVLWSRLVVKIFWMWRSFFPFPWIKIIVPCLVLVFNLGVVGDLCQTALN